MHFLRELLGHVRRDTQSMLSALIRPIFEADQGEQARELVTAALERLEALPKTHELLAEAEEDLLAFYLFPSDHWPKLRPTRWSASTARSAAVPTSSASS